MSFLGGLFGGRGGKRGAKRAAAEARALELEGQLARAADVYATAGLGDDAARVLLLRSEAEVEPERRLALCLRAAEVATSEASRKGALARKARIALDVAIARKVALPSELTRIAAELEEAGDPERAADAYALAGDHDGEVRALTAAGAIDRLEDRLRTAETVARRDRAQRDVLAKLKDLEACSERREALRVARRYLEEREDDRVRETLRDVERRLLRGPVCELVDEGRVRRIAFGEEVTVGRGDATIVIFARAASRRHLAIRRTDDGLALEVRDLDTRNGTRLAGARLQGPLRIDGPVELSIGGEVPCLVTPLRGADGALLGATVDVTGEAFEAPLGPLGWGPGWSVDRAVVDGEAFVELRSTAGAPAFRGSLRLAPRVELAAGDEIAGERSGPVVLAARARGPTASEAGG